MSKRKRNFSLLDKWLGLTEVCYEGNRQITISAENTGRGYTLKECFYR